jgi:hypothetical protein
MEVIIIGSFLKDIKTKPKAVIAAVEKLIVQLEASESLEHANIDLKKIEAKEKVKIITA